MHHHFKQAIGFFAKFCRATSRRRSISTVPRRLAPILLARKPNPRFALRSGQSNTARVDAGAAVQRAAVVNNDFH